MPGTSIRRLAPSIFHEPVPSSCDAVACPCAASAVTTAFLTLSGSWVLVGATEGALANAPSVRVSANPLVELAVAGNGVTWREAPDAGSPSFSVTSAAAARALSSAGELLVMLDGADVDAAGEPNGERTCGTVTGVVVAFAILGGAAADAVRVGFEEGGVRVERLEHAADGTVDQLVVIHVLHVVVLYIGEHASENVELVVRAVLRQVTEERRVRPTGAAVVCRVAGA